MTTYTQSIWQKIRNLFTSGYDKVAAKEVQVANAVRGKLAGVGYTLTRLVFFVVKLAVVVFLVWLAMWLFLFMMVWLAIRFFTFNRAMKQHYRTQQSSTIDETVNTSTEKRTRTYDNNGNLID